MLCSAELSMIFFITLGPGLHLHVCCLHSGKSVFFMTRSSFLWSFLDFNMSVLVSHLSYSGLFLIHFMRCLSSRHS